MALPWLKTGVSEHEYAEMEAKADYRSEFCNGQVYAMSGGTDIHSALCASMIRHVGNQLDGRRCRVFDSNLRIRVTKSELQTYPDVSVVCGPLKFWEQRTDCIVNPVVVVEVLSEGTAGYDRGFKFSNYKLIESLREYVLVWQTRERIEVYRRGDGGEWEHQIADGRKAKVDLKSIGVTLSLAEVYFGLRLRRTANW